MASSGKNRAAIKALTLVSFLAAAIILVRFTPVRDHLSPHRITTLVESAGGWAPVFYILGYAVGVCFFIPGTLLTVIGAAVFGPYLGFAYVWVGAMIGATLAFFIGRYLGRDFAAARIGDRLRRYDQAIERNGFAATLYLRLIYFPFNLMNYGMGLTGVKFRDYFTGTALGILVGTFIFTFAVGTIKEVAATGLWENLMDWRVFLSIGLFIFSFFIPAILKKIKKISP